MDGLFGGSDVGFGGSFVGDIVFGGFVVGNIVFRGFVVGDIIVFLGFLVGLFE